MKVIIHHHHHHVLDPSIAVGETLSYPIAETLIRAVGVYVDNANREISGAALSAIMVRTDGDGDDG